MSRCFMQPHVQNVFNQIKSNLITDSNFTVYIDTGVSNFLEIPEEKVALLWL